MKAKTKSVSVRCNVELKQFQHFHLEVTVEPAPGDSLGKTVDDLKALVAEELMRAKFGDQDVSPMADFLVQGALAVEESKKQMPVLRRRRR